MEEPYWKETKFDEDDMLLLGIIITVFASATGFLILLGPILQLPEPIGPTLWIISTMVTTMLIGWKMWRAERKLFMKQIRSRLGLGPNDKNPRIPVVPFLPARYFEYDGKTSKRVKSSKTTGFHTVYKANSRNFGVITVVDSSPLAVWDKTLRDVSQTYHITNR